MKEECYLFISGMSKPVDIIVKTMETEAITKSKDEMGMQDFNNAECEILYNSVSRKEYYNYKPNLTSKNIFERFFDHF